MKRTSLVRICLGLVLFAGQILAASHVLADDQPASPGTSQHAEDFRWQGEYSGKLTVDGEQRMLGVQLVAGGDGKFDIVFYPGGLPGDGWEGDSKREMEGKLDGDKLVSATGGFATLQDSELQVFNARGETIGTLKKVHRESPTLGLPAPPHAKVLFDGTNTDALESGEMTDDGLLAPAVFSKEKFQDFRLHLEFRTPFMPEARGQARGNSGAYMQGRYEVQILDSFGLEGLDNECGGIYGVKAPDLNMAYPPETWQTYDIDFTAARFDEQGRKTSDPRISVRHNGVLIHDDVTIPGATRSSKVEEGPEPGPLYLQDHSNPVRFRNIWIVEQSSDESKTN